MKRPTVFIPLIIILMLAFSSFFPACVNSKVASGLDNTKTTLTDETNTSLHLGNTSNEETGPIESTSVGFAKSTLTLAKTPHLHDSINLEYSYEKIDPGSSLPEKIWVEFHRYDPSLFYPLGRGDNEEFNIEMMNILATKGTTSQILQNRLYAENQPVSLVPSDSVVVSGKTEWDSEKSPDQKEDKIAFNSTVRFDEPGEWLILLKLQRKGHSSVIPQEIRFTIADSTGFEGWPQNYQPNKGYPLLDSDDLFNVGLTIERAPALNESTEITCTLISVVDLKEVTAELTFKLMEQGGTTGKIVPLKDVVIEGNPVWQGDLYKDTPVQFSLTVRFPETGDWEIGVYGTSSESPYDSSAYIFINSDKETGRIGWIESHAINFGDIPEQKSN